ncbi:MAG: hypothetical protein OEM81_13665 [Acidimicrobiia bacterium]|nr:hypothetical protein [Acidimicrobiia bacterium]MDH3398859.1 hypothetical protein [Acidimicrobiia bacterium]MDH5615010.1 hypothetical protein [Acidimicrobiia bacterium]
MSAKTFGMILGISLAVIWHWLGGDAVLWSVILGLVGFLVGWVFENPHGLIKALQRLDR